MAEFIYATSLRIPRPWLIDAKQLESLDNIVNEEEAKLSKRNKEKLDIEIEKRLKDDVGVEGAIFRKELELDRKRLKGGPVEEVNDEEFIEEVKQTRRTEIRSLLLNRSYSDYNQDRSLTIHLKKNKKVVVKSFDEALRQQSLIDEMPVGFRWVLNSGEIKCQIDLERNGTLDITVSPEHLPESRESFAALQRWAVSIRPPKWQQLWAFVNPLQWMLFFVVLFVSFVLVGDTEATAKRYHKEQAYQLLKDGISQDEQLKSIETLLALDAGYIPPNLTVQTPSWLKLLLYGGLLTFLALSFPPKSRIGVGKGERSIKSWRIWIRIVFVVVPGFVFLNMIWPWLSGIISQKL